MPPLPLPQPKQSAPLASVTRTVPSSSSVAREPGAPLPREGTLLLEARRLLETDPARALVLVHQHEREFPVSQLAPERTRIAAEAQRRIGGTHP
jgi:hypothetical protein